MFLLFTKRASSLLMTAAFLILMTFACRESKTSGGKTDNTPEALEALSKQISQEPEIPEPNIPLFVTNRDQAIREYQQKYAGDHFFDQVDFADPRLTRIPAYGEKLRHYFVRFVIPHPDSLTEQADLILNKAKANDSVYVWTARFLYAMFREAPIRGNTEVYNALAENFILRDSLIFRDGEFVRKVRERLSKSQLNPLGSVASELLLSTPDGKSVSLHGIKSPLTIILFFDPGCDACHPITARLLELHNSHPEKFQVFAVYTGRVKEEWIKYINDKQLKWINVWDPAGPETVESRYDVHSMPLMYLLDKDKKVVSKDISVENLIQILL